MYSSLLCNLNDDNSSTNWLDESLLLKIKFSKTYIISKCVEYCRGDFFEITKSALFMESIFLYIFWICWNKIKFINMRFFLCKASFNFILLRVLQKNPLKSIGKTCLLCGRGGKKKSEKGLRCLIITETDHISIRKLILWIS